MAHVEFRFPAADFEQTAKDYETLVIPVFKGKRLGTDAGNFDAETGYLLEQQLSLHEGLQSNPGETLTLSLSDSQNPKRIVLVSTGISYKTNKTPSDWHTDHIGKALYQALKPYGNEQALLSRDFDDLSASDDYSAFIADTINQEDYRFDKYITETEPLGDLRITVETKEQGQNERRYKALHAVTEAQKWAKDLTNEPSNKLYPAEYADRIKDTLSPLGVKVTILDDEDLEQMGAGAISSVGQGSSKENKPRMVIMEYDGSNGQDTSPPLGLIGKGVTHDSGGMNIKSAKMEKMHMDMGGSAAIVGTMKAIAARGSTAKVVAIVGLAKNDVDANAYQPGDIITSLSGKTIHIGNTDAEGRLVMADCLTHLQREYNPSTIIDAATLTGAVSAIFGPLYAGVFTPADDLWTEIEQAGKTSYEEGWRLPLHKVFERAMKGKRSDLTNLSTIGFGGGSTAAEFLHNFIEYDEQGHGPRWAHLDIAGAAMPPGGMANGFGVRLLDQFIKDTYEKPGGYFPVPGRKPS